MRQLISKVKKAFVDFKWQIFIVVTAILIAASYFTVSDRTRRDKLIDQILDSALDKRAEIVRETIEISEERIEEYEEKIKKVEKRLKEIREQKENTEVEVPGMTLREISDAFEDLGY